jgi:hypothetical protein
MYEDDREAPDYQSVWFQFANRKLRVGYEIRSGHTNTEAGMGDPNILPFKLGSLKRDAQGVIFIGREGHMVFPDYNSYHVFLGRDREPGPERVGEGDPFSDLPHFRNFLKAVRSRRSSDLTADVSEGHMSASMCHLANIATRLTRSLDFDPKTERFRNDPEADRLLGRSYRKPYQLPVKI